MKYSPKTIPITAFKLARTKGISIHLFLNNCRHNKNRKTVTMEKMNISGTFMIK
jgi:hypothetical protein